MELKKLAAKVAEYNERLERGKANKIKPSHVKKVIEKLHAREQELQAEIDAVQSEEKRARLERKLRVAEEHVARAEYLLKQIA